MSKIRTQREAVATSLCCDIAEIDEYQPGRWNNSLGTKVFHAGNGYAIALKPGKSIPKILQEGFEKFVLQKSLAGVNGWEIYISDGDVK